MPETPAAGELAREAGVYAPDFESALPNGPKE